MLVTEGRWWEREADWDGCTVSILCCAEIDLTFKLPTFSDLSSMKVIIFCSENHDLNLLQPAVGDCYPLKSLVSEQRGDRTDEKRERKRQKRSTYWTGRCGPLWAAYRLLNPSQSELPVRNGTRCQVLNHLPHRSPLG